MWSAMGGHSRFFRMYKRIAWVDFLEGTKRDIQQFIAACDIYLRNKFQTSTPAGILQPLPVPTQVWTNIFNGFH